LEEQVDTLIVVPNDRVAELCQNNVSFLQAFRHADEVLHNGVRAISELITVPGLINLDFADVRTVMKSRGRALMGIGIAKGEDRAVCAAKEAIVCPLLEQSNIEGAMGVIVNIKGGCDIGMREIQQAVTTVQKSAHPNANIIFGAVVDEEERPELQVTVIAAGFPKEIRHVHDAPAPEEFRFDSDLLNAPPQPAPKPEPIVVAHVPAPAPKEPEYLWPDEELRPRPAHEETVLVDADEDMGIPAFMRKRKKKE
jgi:cell division protein FtsZ